MSKSLSRFYAVAIKINIALLFAFLPCYFCLHALAKNHVAYADDAVVIDVPIVLDDEVETYGGVRVQKFDSETNKNIAQGNATLQGVKFAIKLKANLSASEINTMATGSLKEDGRTQKDVIVNNKTYSAGSIVTYIYTNSDGVAQTGSAADGKTATASLPSTDRTLPAGIYTIEEVSGDNKTYLTSDTTARTFRIGNNYVASNNATLRGDGVIVTSTFDPLKQKTDGTFEAGESLIKSSEKGFKNTVVRGGVKIRKQDFETKLTTPQGNASLNGTTFEIINKSSKAVLVDGTSYATGAVCKTITVKDGVAETAHILLEKNKLARDILQKICLRERLRLLTIERLFLLILMAKQMTFFIIK